MDGSSLISNLRPWSPYGHVCWSYDDPAAFDSRAREFLAEGLAAGERVWYVASEPPGAVVERLRGVSVFEDGFRRGAARVVPVDSTYSGSGVVDPVAQVGVYASATGDALAAGYTGLRVLADATPLVRTSAQLDAFARYEHLIDRYMRTRPMSALCAYNRLELGDQAVAELACLHPVTNADEVLFQLYACDPDDGCATLTGELDPSNHELFATALERADLRPVDGQLVLWAPRLRYVDHRSLLHLQDYARRRGATAVLRTSRSPATRLVELLDLADVRVEAAR